MENDNGTTMSVIKRDGTKQPVKFDNVFARIEILCKGKEIGHELKKVNPYQVAQNVCARIYDGVKTSELDELAAQICSSMMLTEIEYGQLASRIIISNLHKKTSPSFTETIHRLYNNKDAQGNHNPLVSKELYEITNTHAIKLNNVISSSEKRDYQFDYFGFKTLERSYLLRVNGEVVERPTHMFMRTALGIHGKDIKDAIETYEYMSKKYFTHATPTLFNAGTPHPQLASCFLLTTKNKDSLKGIFETLTDCAEISKYAGGIGLDITHIRGHNSKIKGTNGTSKGIVPMLRMFNAAARYVDQGGKRNGSFSVYIEMWHPDIVAFLELKKNHGAEEDRARDLFYALWICDEFMERVKRDDMWSLMCPDTCPGLQDVYGEEFSSLYKSYEEKGMFVKQIRAQKLWTKVIISQIETGTPYMLYKDHVNRKNNQMNLGVIRSSNLCTEIMEHTNENEIAVCNLASLCLPTYLVQTDGKLVFDFEQLQKVVKIVVKNLNKIIDLSFYPVEKARNSNNLHRPIGIGVQGLADTFMLMKIPFDSAEARALNRDIFETMYFAALQASMELAQKHGKTYSSFEGSPTSKGILQFDLWNVKVSNERHDWTTLKSMIMQHGLMNSLLIAPMPTASTSQIMGFNEAFEPLTSNIYRRKTMAGDFIVINKYLISQLQQLGIWNADVRNKIILNDGSIQNIECIPQDIKELYKTVWEISPKVIIDMAADRGVFVDQSQSMNLFVETPDYKKMTSIHFYAWSKGLKTGMYYLRTKPKAKAQQFTMDQNIAKYTNISTNSIDKPKACPLRPNRDTGSVVDNNNDDEACFVCSS